MSLQQNNIHEITTYSCVDFTLVDQNIIHQNSWNRWQSCIPQRNVKELNYWFWQTRTQSAARCFSSYSLINFRSIQICKKQQHLCIFCWDGPASIEIDKPKNSAYFSWLPYFLSGANFPYFQTVKRDFREKICCCWLQK